VEIDLDEMPFGIFLEIEGPDAESIRQTVDQLELKWDTRSTISYIGLYEKVCEGGIDGQHITFEKLKGKTYSAADFGLIPADA